MRTWIKTLVIGGLLLLGVIAAHSLAASDSDAEVPYARLLSIRIHDADKDLGLFLLHQGRPESLARKFYRLQCRVAELSSGETLPLFLQPSVALRELPASEINRLGVALMDIDVNTALNILCEFAGVNYRITSEGILIYAGNGLDQRADPAQSTAP